MNSTARIFRTIGLTCLFLTFIAQLPMLAGVAMGQQTGGPGDESLFDCGVACPGCLGTRSSCPIAAPNPADCGTICECIASDCYRK